MMIASAGQGSLGLWSLFVQSFDLFSIILILGSLIAVGIIVRVIMEIRPGAIMPAQTEQRARMLIDQDRIGELRTFVKEDESFVGLVLRAALDSPNTTRQGVREAAEMVASEQTARWFRKIEVLNVIGNVAPLVGLAGTVWGMILAFTSLGVTGGQAGPTDLSLGISKALFHTLLGLLLAIPCLTVFGVYRSMIDRVCTRGMVVCAELVEKLAGGDE